jgi:hypothetical protein
MLLNRQVGYGRTVRAGDYYLHMAVATNLHKSIANRPSRKIPFILCGHTVGLIFGLEISQVHNFTINRQLNVINYEEVAPIKIEFGVTIRVEGELLTKSGKKGTRASDRSISMLALLSTGDYVTYRRIGCVFTTYSH